MPNMDKNTLEAMEVALEKAKNELSYAIHLGECGGNAGIRKMNDNKAAWLTRVIYLAERGLEYEKGLSKSVTIAAEEPPKTDYQKALMLFKSIKNNFIK